MIDISKDHKKDLTILTVKGELTAPKMIQAIEEFYKKGPTKYALWNLLKAKGASFTTYDIENIIAVILRHENQRKNGKTVLVVSRDYEYGMSRIHIAKAELRHLSIKYHVTRSMDEAMEWLGVRGDE
ncbi:MAG: hypothetical protein JXR46_06285 [Calditrichaceae bacterium]|nr:hypothetical protein [Calditrichaceae bacterium]MBN2708635.1 hypothetical protein [Calditrichaceae bacterium]RQV92030.1 MAG: hypothetical protein EH224_16645 [Calditrichota bacterium]